MRSVLAVLLVAVAVGCAGTRQPRSEAPRSGFLGDYTMLKAGEGDQAQLVYLNPGFEPARYGSVLLSPVTLWAGEGESGLSKLSREDQQMLADRLHTALHDALAKDHALVEQPGPGVLRVSAALTDAKGSNVPLDVVATVIPQIRMGAMLVGMGADTAGTVGRVTGELEVADSASGERLIAAVDERVGTRGIGGMTDKWDDLQRAFDDWAERVRARVNGQVPGAKEESPAK
jgi:hypothetical protein